MGLVAAVVGTALVAGWVARTWWGPARAGETSDPRYLPVT